MFPSVAKCRIVRLQRNRTTCVVQCPEVSLLQNLTSKGIKRMDEDRESIVGNYKGQTSKEKNAKRKLGAWRK